MLALEPAPEHTDDPVPVPDRRPGWWRLPVLAVAGGLAVFELRGRLPSLPAVWAALHHAAPGWLVAAVGLQIVSMVAFAEQERRLLAAFEVAMPARISVAVTFARSAMATALPGGSAVSAAYGFRQFRARGATKPVAGAVTLLCGAVSVAGLAVVYAGDAVLGSGAMTGAAIAAVVAGLLGLGARRLRRVSEPAPTEPGSSRLRRLRHTLHETLVFAALIPARRWLVVLALAALNWLADLVCLLACLRALDLHVPVPVVAAAYLGAQIARQIPGTAAGIGVIEAGLILAMTTSGAPAAVAAAAVLTYRLLSCWILLPVGAACWSLLRTPVR